MSALDNIRERLTKVEALIPDPQYAQLVQSMRNDIRILMATVDTALDMTDAFSGTEVSDEIRCTADRMEMAIYQATAESTNPDAPEAA